MIIMQMHIDDNISTGSDESNIIIFTYVYVSLFIYVCEFVNIYINLYNNIYNFINCF